MDNIDNIVLCNFCWNKIYGLRFTVEELGGVVCESCWVNYVSTIMVQFLLLCSREEELRMENKI